MKQCSKCWEFKPLSLFHNDKSKSDGRTAACAACRTKHTISYSRKNKVWKTESYKKRNKKRMQTDKAKRLAVHASTKWQRNNRSKSVPYNRANAAMRRVQLKYPDAVCCTLTDILPFYERAFELEQQSGILHQVDHHVPLVGGGLHHPDNLVVLSENEHKEKSLNEFELMKKLLKEYFANNSYGKDK